MSGRRCILAILLIVLLVPSGLAAQTTAVLRGVVRDADGGVLPGAVAVVAQPASGLTLEAVARPDGAFQVGNIPLGSYELRIDFPGFAPFRRTVDLRSTVPVELDVTLPLLAQTAAVQVRPEPALIDAASGGTRHRLGQARIETLPAPVGGRGLEAVLASFPGFAQNANGAIHPRGAHNQMTYLVDGLPISDQLTGAFANALDAGIVQNLELMTSNIPASFGGKVSGVAVVTSRSGLGLGRRAAGDAVVALAGAGTRQAALQVGGGSDRAGYFVSFTTMRTDRFLDPISRDNLHNAGGFGRGFARVDLALSSRDVLRLNGMGGRSAFEVANLRSQQAAGQDQRQALADGAGWASYLRTLGATATLESTVGLRHATAALRPSAGDTPVTASQQRSLETFTATVRYTRVAGAHEVQGGAELQRFPVREAFSLGLVSPTFNDPSSATFNPALLPHDLSRGGVPFRFAATGTGRSAGVYGQARLRAGAATVTLGLRGDTYAFLVDGAQWQPRLGVAWRLPGEHGVVRLSYNRNFQTPPNENLLLSNSPEAAALAPESVKQALGGTYRAVQPERQQVLEAGYERGLAGGLSLDLSVYRKTSRDQQDNNNFFDTGIIFPTTLAAIRVTGAEARLTVPARHGVAGSLSVTTGRAISTPPFTGGLFLGQDAIDLLSSGPFAIDHDQRLSLHGTVHADLPGPLWLGGSARHDSGLVSNPSDPAEVAADPDFADLLPLVNLTASVPRVRPRTIVDAVAGWDLRLAGRSRWSVQVQVTNLTGRTALYNFQSVFVGTRLVAPRTLAVRLKHYF